MEVKKLEDDKYYIINDKGESFCAGNAAPFVYFENRGVAYIRNDKGLYDTINSKFEFIQRDLKEIPNNKVQGSDYWVCQEQTLSGAEEIVLIKYKEFWPGYEESRFQCGLAVVKKNDGKYYFVDRDYNTVNSEGFAFCAQEFVNNLAIVQKIDGKYYIIDKDMQDVYEGTKNPNDTWEKYTEINKHYNNIHNRKNLTGTMDQYLAGEVDVRLLPDDCFEGENLNKILENEKKLYEYNLNMAHQSGSLEDMKNISEEAQRLAEAIKTRAYEVNQKKQRIIDKAEENDFNLF